MGAEQSSNKGQVLSKSGQPPAFVQQQEPPYPGPAPEYKFINTNVSIGARFAFGGSAGQELVTSSVDSYYPFLASQYAEGFRLLSFVRTPQELREGGLFCTSVSVPFQGILCRYPYRNEGWRLQVEKSVIQTQFVYNGIISSNSASVADASSLTQSVINNTQIGGRLLCVELTGQEISQGFSAGFAGRSPIHGVDLFYEIPTHPNPEIYTYQIVPVSIQVYVNFGRSITIGCDWAGILGSYLSQGWRLVEVFLDSGKTNPKFLSTTSAVSSMWFFEKPSSALQDQRPRYQGTYVEHMVPVRAGFSGAHSECGWEGKVQEMGRNGWELASVLQTPEIHYQGGFSNSYDIKFILFFQRKIIGYEGAGAPVPQMPPQGNQPPSYDSLQQKN
ncbi:hypothetical protein SNE40_021008 [Patella caerulea]|uniref:Uncharacterized protein n=1 Tax=Patella caerulea TaxID=87958 RepID=A0AAN8GD17_PATCE